MLMVCEFWRLRSYKESELKRDLVEGRNVDMHSSFTCTYEKVYSGTGGHPEGGF